MKRFILALLLFLSFNLFAEINYNQFVGLWRTKDTIAYISKDKDDNYFIQEGFNDESYVRAYMKDADLQNISILDTRIPIIMYRTHKLMKTEYGLLKIDDKYGDEVMYVLSNPTNTEREKYPNLKENDIVVNIFSKNFEGIFLKKQNDILIKTSKNENRIITNKVLKANKKMK